jgi:hypothetical protein
MALDHDLSRLLGEISSDVKHILVRQDKQDARIERMTTRLDSVEKFHYKLLGIAAVIPAALTSLGLYIKS